jgi:pilin isopeptide linkage protein
VTAPVQAANLPYGVVTNSGSDNVKNVKLTLEAELTLTGDTTTDKEEFTFVLAATDGAPLPESETAEASDTDDTDEDVAKVTIKGDGEITFGPITYTKRGDYTYTLYQEPGENTQYTYDDTEYQIKVTVDRSEGVFYAFYTCYEVEKPDKEETGATVDETEPSASPDVTQQPASVAKADDLIFNNTYEAPYVPPYTPPSNPSPSPSPEASPEPSPETSPEPSEDVEPSPEPSEEPEPSENPSEGGPETTPGPSAGPGDGMDNDNKVSNGPGVEESPSPSDKNATEVGPGTSGGPGGPGSSVKPGTTPKTGDETDNSLWIGMLSLAAAGLVGCMLYVLVPRKRRHR